MEIDRDSSAVTIPLRQEVRAQFEQLRKTLPFLEYVHDLNSTYAWSLRGMSPRFLDLRITFYYPKVNGNNLNAAEVTNLNAWLEANAGEDPGRAIWHVSIGKATLDSFEGEMGGAEKVLKAVAILMSTQAADGEESIIPVRGHYVKQRRVASSSSDSSEENGEDFMELSV